jgi:hypothetical protein
MFRDATANQAHASRELLNAGDYATTVIRKHELFISQPMLLIVCLTFASAVALQINTDIASTTRPPTVIVSLQPAVLASLYRTSRLHRSASHRRIQVAINNTPVTCNTGFPTRPRSFSRIVVDIAAKLRPCYAHFPSSPTMSLRSDDADTTRNAKSVLCFLECK